MNHYSKYQPEFVVFLEALPSDVISKQKTIYTQYHMHENTLGGQFVGPGQISRKKWAQEKETMPATRRTWPCCPSNWEIKLQ